MSRLSVAVVLISALAVASCASQRPTRGQEVKGLDRKLSTFAYIEEGEIVTFIVNTKPARDRDGAPYVPFEIAVANTGVRQLRLTRESFTLIDADGNRYPTANPRELYEDYDFLDFDRNLAELENVVFNKFAAFRQYPSNFSPRRDTGAEVVRDLVSLPKFGYCIDFLYFPAPQSGIRGQRFDLFMDSPDLTDPVFVKFEVR